MVLLAVRISAWIWEYVYFINYHFLNFSAISKCANLHEQKQMLFPIISFIYLRLPFL